jgi:hypothetical protein
MYKQIQRRGILSKYEKDKKYYVSSIVRIYQLPAPLGASISAAKYPYNTGSLGNHSIHGFRSE